MGRVLAIAALILAAAGASAQDRMVHSRGDLLLGTTLDRFFDFEGGAREWRGAGSFESGVLRIGAPFVGDWVRAFYHWEGGDPFALEWEARPAGGPLEAEFALLLGYEPGLGEVRVRFSPEGVVAVDRLRGGFDEAITPVVSQTVQRGAGWGSYAVRAYRGRLSVVVAGEEVLNAELPGPGGGAIGFAVSPGGIFEFDHVALYRSRRGAPAPEARPGERPIYFDSYSIGRDEWMRGLFPAREGALVASAPEGETFTDLLALPLPEACRVRVAFRISGTGRAGFLFHARAEGDAPGGYVCEAGADGAFALYLKESPA
ncbi:MAG: hypothetical protein ABIH26_09720, partial [Candidatus Eisenbacteria bacterium]